MGNRPASLVKALVAEQKIITIVRTDSAERAMKAAQAVRAGGLRLIDIPVTVPGVFKVIEKLAENEDIIQGAGSVTTMNEATDAIKAGCSFIICPHTDRQIIDYCRDNGIFVAAGGLTPTEIMDAYLAGVDMVAVYPVNLLGNAVYTEHLLSPMPFLPLMPVGGITVEIARQHLDAGATAVGVINAIVDTDAISRGDYDFLTAQSRSFVSAISGAKKKD